MSLTQKLLQPSLRTSYDSLRDQLAEQIIPTEEIQDARENPIGFVAVGNIKMVIKCQDDKVISEWPAEISKTLGWLFKLHKTSYICPGTQPINIRKTYKSMADPVLQTCENKVISAGSQVRANVGSKASWYDYPESSKVWVDGLAEQTHVLSLEHDITYAIRTEELSLIELETLSTYVTGHAGNIANLKMSDDRNPGHTTCWIMSKKKTGQLALIDTTHKENPSPWVCKAGSSIVQGERSQSNLSIINNTMRQSLPKGIWALPEGALCNMLIEEDDKAELFYTKVLWPRVVAIDLISAKLVAMWSAYDPVQGVHNSYCVYLEPFNLFTLRHFDSIFGLYKGEIVFIWITKALRERQANTDLTVYGIPAMSPPVTDVKWKIFIIQPLLFDCKLVVHFSLLFSSIKSVFIRDIPTPRRGITKEIADKESTICKHAPLHGGLPFHASRGNALYGENLHTDNGRENFLCESSCIFCTCTNNEDNFGGWMINLYDPVKSLQIVETNVDSLCEQ